MLPSKNCPKCGRILIKKSGKFGDFFACPGFPACKHTEKIIYTREEPVKKEGLNGSFSPTLQQGEIGQALLRGNGHIMVKAAPGTGKTTTLLYLLSLIPNNKSILFLAFNKSIVSELESRIAQDNVQVKTLHSFGLRIIKTINTRVRIDKNKEFTILKNMGLMAEDDIKKMASPLIKTLNLLRANLLPISDETIKEICDYYAIEYPASNYNIPVILERLYKETQETINFSVSFDDMVNAPLDLPSSVYPRFDYVLCDEFQDFSKGNLKLLQKLQEKNSSIRFIMVGDENQSIYGFRGANVNSMEEGRAFFNPVVLPLSLTHRIPALIVEFLNNAFPYIELTSKKEGGILETIQDSKFLAHLTSQNSALVVCRYNAPLVSYVLSLLREGYHASIKGKDIGQEIVNLVAKHDKDNTLFSLLESLEHFYNVQYNKYINARDKSFLEVLNDKIEVIRALSENEQVNDTMSLMRFIESIFSDESSPFTFSSIHKAKGLEHESVYALFYDNWQSKRATSEEQIQQEINAKWVGLTRAKNALYLIPSPKK